MYRDDMANRNKELKDAMEMYIERYMYPEDDPTIGMIPKPHDFGELRDYYVKKVWVL